MVQKKQKQKTKKEAGGVLVILVMLALVIWTFQDQWQWLLVAGALVALLGMLFAVRKLKITSDMSKIDSMGGHEFERFLVKLFKKHGYKVTLVGASGSDFGADLIIEKNHTKVAVQAKNYDTNKVGNEAVQQAVAGAAYYDCSEAMVVTNSTFTKAAKQQADGSNLPVSMWDRKALEKAIR